MKIKLPEKRFFSLQELAERWECKASDIEHLIDTRELQRAVKAAALQGKRGLFVGFYPYQVDPKFPGFIPIPSKMQMEMWEKSATPDRLMFHHAIPVERHVSGDFTMYILIDGPMPPDIELENTAPKSFGSRCAKEITKWREREPKFFETVILLQDVLRFESKCLENERSENSVDGQTKPLQTLSDNTLVSTIAALLASWPGGKPPSGKDLEKAAASVGVSVSDDSIRKALKAAREIAPILTTT